ncbi:MAG: hypothetical protein ABEK10_00950 [Candidatus Nanosalina sp.]
MDEMKIYIGHSTSMEYRKKLYQPLKNSRISRKHELVLPHDSDGLFNSKRFLREGCDLFVAEVSRDSTGLGIELGWADEFGVNVICVAEAGSDPSEALKAVSDKFMFYSTPEELVKLVENELEK